MNGFLRSGSGFVFSLEACFSLVCFVVLISVFSFHVQEDFSEVMVFKKASDFLDVVIKDGSLEEGDESHLKLLLDELDLKARVEIDGNVVFDDCPREMFVLRRTMVTEDLEYKRVVLTVGV